MGEFLEGWNRKMGIVTLLISLLLLCAWIRSQITEEEIAIPFHSNTMTHIVNFYPDLIRVTNASVYRSGGRLHRLAMASFDIPLWPAITLSTLLSAYLLLSKPSKSIQNKLTAPIANEGG